MTTPINYNYTTIEAEEVPSKNNNLQNESPNNSLKKNPRYIWDGGLLSNPPQREANGFVVDALNDPVLGYNYD
jgi:hypothetical protein